MTKTEITHELPGNVMIDGQALTRIQALAVARHHATVSLGIEINSTYSSRSSGD